MGHEAKHPYKTAYSLSGSHGFYLKDEWARLWNSRHLTGQETEYLSLCSFRIPERFYLNYCPLTLGQVYCRASREVAVLVCSIRWWTHGGGRRTFVLWEPTGTWVDESELLLVEIHSAYTVTVTKALYWVHKWVLDPLWASLPSIHFAFSKRQDPWLSSDKQSVYEPKVV